MILFIPGIKGSELWEGDNKRWFPKNLDDLAANAINNELKAETPIGAVNAYGKKKIIYEYLLDKYPSDIFDYHSYDWRKPIQSSVGELVHTIVNYTNNNEKLYLLAHSMGGMLAKLAILELEKLGLSNRVSRLITVGTPWRGSPDAYKVLSYGEPGIFPSLFQFAELFDDKKTCELARQFPSVYQLLPSEEYYSHGNSDEGKFIFPSDDNGYPSYNDVLSKVRSLYDTASIKLGNKGEDIYDTYMKELQKAMLQPLPKNVEHDCLIGCNYFTLYKLPAESLEKRSTFKSECEFEDGDGVVPIYSAQPPHLAQNYYVAGQHAFLFQLNHVLEFIDWCVKDKVGNRPDWIYDEPLGSIFTKSLEAKIMCPVNTTILDSEGNYVAGTFDPSVSGISDLAFDNDIMYYSIGESKYVFFMDKLHQDIKLKINSYDTGVADVSIRIFKDTDVTELSFEPLPVNNNVAAELIIPIKTEIEKAYLKTDHQSLPAKIQKSKLSDSNKLQVKPDYVPKLSINISNADDTQKALYRRVYSGKVLIDIQSDNDELIKDIYFVINDGQNDRTPVRYTGSEHIVTLPSGEYTIRAFGKDKYNRPTPETRKKFKIDDDRPVTKLFVEVNPEGLIISFKSITNGAKTNIYYRVNSKNFSPVSENEKVPVGWGKLRVNRNDKLTIEYYSENEFGAAEESIKKFVITQGNIGLLMWEDYSSFVSPEMIWENVLKHNDTLLSDMEIQFIGKGLSKATPSQRVPDNVKGVKFLNKLIEIDVMYSEKYSLFFYGPPTEILKVGQKYEFTFELITERSKERIVHTKPSATLRPVRSRQRDVPLEVRFEDGLFKSHFRVDNSFLTTKYKLVITDLKNTHPALREIPLTLGEDYE